MKKFKATLGYDTSDGYSDLPHEFELEIEDSVLKRIDETAKIIWNNPALRINCVLLDAQWNSTIEPDPFEERDTRIQFQFFKVFADGQFYLSMNAKHSADEFEYELEEVV